MRELGGDGKAEIFLLVLRDTRGKVIGMMGRDRAHLCATALREYMRKTPMLMISLQCE